MAIREIADRLLALAGTSLEFETDPSLVRPVEVPVLRGDPAGCPAATGWKPEIPLDQTLADVLAYWRQHADVIGARPRPEQAVSDGRPMGIGGDVGSGSWVRASLAWTWACLARSRAWVGSRSSSGATAASSRSMISSSRSARVVDGGVDGVEGAAQVGAHGGHPVLEVGLGLGQALAAAPGAGPGPAGSRARRRR